MKRRRIVWSLVSALAASCGSAPDASLGEELTFGFRMHALKCQREDLTDVVEVALQASGIQGICPLTLNADRTVSGSCYVKTGESRVFRLVYSHEDREGYSIDLAAVEATLDLTLVRNPQIVLEFRQENLRTLFDDDGDGRTNLVEFCSGTDPRRRDS